MINSNHFKTISGVILVSAFMFAGKVLFDIYDFSRYDASQLNRDLLWAFGSGIFIMLVIPFIRQRVFRQRVS